MRKATKWSKVSIVSWLFPLCFWLIILFLSKCEWGHWHVKWGLLIVFCRISWGCYLMHTPSHCILLWKSCCRGAKWMRATFIFFHVWLDWHLMSFQDVISVWDFTNLMTLIQSQKTEEHSPSSVSFWLLNHFHNPNLFIFHPLAFMHI